MIRIKVLFLSFFITSLAFSQSDIDIDLDDSTGFRTWVEITHQSFWRHKDEVIIILQQNKLYYKKKRKIKLIENEAIKSKLTALLNHATIDSLYRNNDTLKYKECDQYEMDYKLFFHEIYYSVESVISYEFNPHGSCEDAPELEILLGEILDQIRLIYALDD